MRVLQLIDSLDAGGAERVAVTFANALVSKVEYSSLCTTRKEGLLKNNLDKGVSYLFLKKNHALDVFAIVRLLRFIKREKINIIHAHATSYFTGTIIKIIKPKMILIWHDHYGNSELLHKRKFKILQWCSFRFNGILCVNKNLTQWAISHLKSKDIRYFKNIVSLPEENDTNLKLKGIEGKRIICVGNFRPQKDHQNLLNAFELVLAKHPEYSLHLFGKNWGDTYFNNIKEQIQQNNLGECVHYYGAQKTTLGLLMQANIGVLSSQSEGLPISLLEYGIAGLAVVCTRVGQCEEVINGFGQCVDPNRPEDLALAIHSYIENIEKRTLDATLFQNHILKNHSIDAIIPILISYYESKR
ncbi:glycosyltransferase [Aureisphaera sp. CAU 1614]|uniref:Glycosyltransferase n=1 Tax=Halomarinibacterium sedimenti TaxID=2857106 RepID=A0A9X1FNI5_9FLAO|nr:glycosyltransferase [Halomarinibacterium sedimenti]MBW2937701.1 glycosyltransferase [Halomarinibacterium sedimenti]